MVASFYWYILLQLPKGLISTPLDMEVATLSTLSWVKYEIVCCYEHGIDCSTVS